MRGAIYLAGPTASGKSAVALLLAERIGGEIISVDSMQVYRGLDIGTAKPNSEERARVPHHLIDVAEIDEPFDVAKFLALAKRADTEIRSRGRIPIYCGGTGLYFKALVSGIGDGPKADPLLRRELEGMPLTQLLEEIEARDPETFTRLDRSNPRRVIRAVEVIRLTGKKYSAQRSNWDDKNQGGNWFGLQRDRANLVGRINRRVDEMFARGLVEETRDLLTRGLDRNPTAMQSLGYSQVVGHLRGERDLAQTIERVKIKTRQFAKRQMTWFKRQLALEWWSVENDIAENAVVAEMVQRIPAVN